MMTKIVVIADVHANLPALEAALRDIRGRGYDVLYHLGEVIGIGPYPSECLDLLLNIPNASFIMGNHDKWFIEGLPQPRPAWMSDGEVEHQRWTHASIDPQLKNVVAQWPYVIQDRLEGVNTTFLHYGLNASGKGFSSIVDEPTSSDLDRIFEEYDSRLIFYGHIHRVIDIQGRKRYFNPGSLGCYEQASARYVAVDFQEGQFALERRSVTYDIMPLHKAFEQRRVPERDFIYRTFFGGLLGD